MTTCACDFCEEPAAGSSRFCHACTAWCLWALTPGLAMFERAAAGIWRWRVHLAAVDRRLLSPPKPCEPDERELALCTEARRLDDTFRSMFDRWTPHDLHHTE